MPSQPTQVINLGKQKPLWNWPFLLVVSLAVSLPLVGVRQLGGLERGELNTLDQFIRWQPDPGVDPRLLVVAVTEEDIQKLGKSDQLLDKVLTKLEQDEPRVIGLDIYRDIPVEPGHIELITTLQTSPNLIAICKSGDADSTGVRPPSTVPEERLAFSDIVVDLDGIVRRSLLSLSPDPNSKCPASSSFSLQLALHYLEKQGIQWQKTPNGALEIGSVRFNPLTNNPGGYQTVDTKGYQILLNYRSPTIARQVSLSQVLNGQIERRWVKDQIVLIGVTASSGNDFFYTPYSATQRNFRMSGVEVHAQMVSQILSAVLDGRPVLWSWPDLVEVVWIWAWAGVGAFLFTAVRRPLLLVMTGGITLAALFGICYVLFLQGGWVPFMPAALAFIGAIALVTFYRGYKFTGEQVPPIPIAPEPVNTIESTVPSWPEPVSLLAGRYRNIAPLSQGGFGKTYLAKDIKRPGYPQCVVKQLQPRENSQPYLKLVRTLFQREAVTLETLGEHDQIPRLLAYFEEHEEFYIVQEFIRGKALSEVLSCGECWSVSQVVGLLKDVLPVLDFIHQRGVIHRDLKPANLIQRQSDGRLVLIDFGAVKLLQARITEQRLESDPQNSPTTICIGTGGYASPEQMMGKPVYSSDLYALGMICIQALSGKSPSQLSTGFNVTELLCQEHGEVEDGFATILSKMTRPSPQERFQNAQEVLQALQMIFPH
ncbi:MAG: CHASE2 domain-containing protein [Acaryochloris sp. SU_5_25]|nr:CHASE2 domain-containing protein [Acaryochloris sp. SU_5_25]